MQQTLDDLFLSDELWADTIQDGYKKFIHNSILERMAQPRYKIGVLKAIQSGEYRLEIPRIGYVPKDDGTLREVIVGGQLDRLVFRQITLCYYKVYRDRMDSACVSYQRGMGVPKIVRELLAQAGNLREGCKIDLRKYFDTVPIEQIDKVLDELDDGSGVCRLIKEYYHTDLVQVKGEVVERYKSLGQGCAFSSFLANVLLKDVDEWGRKNCTVYRRYSDDILILDRDWRGKLEVIRGLLETKGLQINDRKTEEISPEKPFVFLGAKIEGKEVDLAPKSIIKYKQKVREILKSARKVKDPRKRQFVAIRKLNNYLYFNLLDDKPNAFGWMQYFGSLCTTDRTIRQLDFWTKDRLKALYTGKNNHTTNQHKTSNEQLAQLGYLSMEHLFKIYKMGADVYKAELHRIRTEQIEQRKEKKKGKTELQVF